MSDQYRSPRVYAVLLGMIVFTLLLMVFCFLSETVKYIGAPFLFLPERLGLIEVASREEVVRIEMSSGSTVLDFERPGKYAVYTKDYDLLVITDSLRQANKNILNPEDKHAWLTITSVDSGEPTLIGFFYRGLRPFDSPLARGRPILYFEIETPGQYQLQYSSRTAVFYIVPDYTTGKEGILYLIYLVEIGVLLIPVWILYSGYLQQKKEKTQEIQSLKQIRGDDFWKNEYQKKKQKEEEDKRSPRRFD